MYAFCRIVGCFGTQFLCVPIGLVSDPVSERQTFAWHVRDSAGGGSKWQVSSFLGG